MSLFVHLQAMAHVLRDDEAPEVKDNACSAIAWLIESCSSQIPLRQVGLWYSIRAVFLPLVWL